MLVTLANPFSRIKRLLALMAISGQIRHVEDDMNAYNHALATNRNAAHRAGLERLLRKAIHKHSMLCARRDVLKREVA